MCGAECMAPVLNRLVERYEWVCVVADYKPLAVQR